MAAAILNAGGYRYGASDQAFYIPAVLHHLDSALFPRDWALIGAQDRLNIFSPMVAGAARLTGLSVPPIFFALYLAGLVALFASAVALGRRLFQSPWTVVALAFALTLRHAIAVGAVNTLEGYMHPRMIAFALGALAVAACLGKPADTLGPRNRPGRRVSLSVALVALAIIIHPTTGAWFALWIAVAIVTADDRLWRPGLAAFGVAAVVVAWAVLAGPLAGRLTAMDDRWLSVLRSKTYLFPTRWPVGGWLPAVLTPLTAAVLFEVRRRRGLVTDAERGVAIGAAVLFAVFVASIPFTAVRLALAVQLQVPRTLWMIDLLAVVYIVWYLAEGAAWSRGPRLARAARNTCIVFLALSLGRGAWVMLVQHRERAVVRVGLPDTDWTDAMQWIAAHTATATWVLAPPGHAWMYGTSVRVAAARDVYLEEAKDTALAMYSRESAETVLARIRGAARFDQLTAEGARAMGPDVLVTERSMNLPLLHASGRFKVYGLK